MKRKVIYCKSLLIIINNLYNFGKVEFTSEIFGTKGEVKTYGQILFKDTNPNDLKEFDRTILSVLLHHYIKDKGDNRLTRDTFDRIREFITSSFDTEGKENLLLYYMVINDLGKSQKVIDILKEKGITSIEHDLLFHIITI